MGSEPQSTTRDAAVRSLLVDLAARPAAAAAPGRDHARSRARLVTAAVLVTVVVLSVLAIGLGAGARHDLAAQGGLPASTPPKVLPTASVPAGTLLGRFTSADGAKQTHTIHPNGLALSVVFACRGAGDWLVHIPHDSDMAAVTPAGQKPGRCDGTSSGAGNKGHAGAATVTIRATPGLRWTLTITGIPETYVTPQPIATPVDTDGTGLPFCTSSDLTARFEAKKEPRGVTEVSGGQIALTNTTDTTCALAGYPMVRFLDGVTVLGHHTMNAVDDRSSLERGLKAVVLKPGGIAYTQIGWYLPNYYPENKQGACVARPVSNLRIDLGNRLAGAAQAGTLTAPVGSTVSACLNGPWGVNGKYGQLSSTVFVDYSLTGKR